ncbi:MAG: metallophosphatase, partial [Deltaproteobacteria bacterium]|nr:metallophosphatase [Deltaproteobacteria bacterium]
MLYRIILLVLLPANAAAQECVAVVATSDLHGAIEPQRADAAAPRIGGVEGLSGYVNSLRELNGERTVLVDGGDLFQGTLASNLSKGRAVVDAYNLLGYDAVAIGNHEFDFGAETPGSSDLLGALKTRISEARFPFLGINVYERRTHQRAAWAKPSVVVDRGGVKIGIIGAATPETARVTRPQNVVSLEFRDPVPLVVAEARRLRAQGARLVVLVMHIGGRCARTRDPYDLSSCEARSDLCTLLSHLPAGSIDVAVGGHTHQEVAHWVHGVATVQPGARAQKIAWVDACLRQDGGLDQSRSRIHPIIDVCLDEWRDGGCGRRKERVDLVAATFRRKPLAPDPAVAQAMTPYLAAVREAYQRPIGVHLSEPLLRDGTPSLGELIGEALVRA